MFWNLVRRDVLVVGGPDAASYLQSQVSQDLRSLPVGRSTWSFVLTPTGKVDGLVRVHRRAEQEFVLDTDAGSGPHLLARLRRFCIRVAVDFALDSIDMVAFRGEGLPVAPTGALDAWGGGFDLVATSPDTARLRAQVPEGSDADLLAARVEACWPMVGAELVAGETVPAETGIVTVAVSFTKGCYPGQELVERMDSRGSSAPWQLVTVDVAPGTVPGDAVHRDGVEIGVVTSVCGTRAIARLRRSAVHSTGGDGA